MYFNLWDVIEAHYWYAADYHTGQSSALYERLCRVGSYYTPGPMHRGYESLSENGQAIYDNLASISFAG